MGGNIETYTDLKITISNHACVLRFYMANMGGDYLILEYPWFAATNPQPDWAAGMLPVSVKIQMAGVVRVRSTLLAPLPKPQTTIG